jgi:N-acetylmuramoyl-L-alanine amidase
MVSISYGCIAISAQAKASVSASSSDLLAHLVYAEARGESYKGKVAVAAVVLNRVKSSKFPNTIPGVIYQKNAFSSVSNGQINLAPDSEAKRAALDALNGYDPTGGCLYFYNKRDIKSTWILSRKVKLTLGNHTFAV